MSRIGQRLEKTPEATFLRELDEENTNLRDAGRSRAATRWRDDAAAHAALRRARHRRRESRAWQRAGSSMLRQQLPGSDPDLGGVADGLVG